MIMLAAEISCLGTERKLRCLFAGVWMGFHELPGDLLIEHIHRPNRSYEEHRCRLTVVARAASWRSTGTE